MPPQYLQVLAYKLRKAGIISAQRGRNGGIRLARPANKITLLQIVKVVAPPKRSVDVPESIAAGSLARLNRSVDASLNELMLQLGRTTLADVVPRR